MAAYICVNCETEVDLEPIDEKVICPKCSHRVLFKKRPETPSKVEAI
ncbi:DNA-directed RNA polymerase subunit P [Candidatus Nanosalina sp. VS9-1]